MTSSTLYASTTLTSGVEIHLADRLTVDSTSSIALSYTGGDGGGAGSAFGDAGETVDTSTGTLISGSTGGSGGSYAGLGGDPDGVGSAAIPNPIYGEEGLAYYVGSGGSRNGR